jgi:phosphoglycolate phosphatase
MTLLFDLDGTLTDSCTGICRCISHALATIGRAPVPEPRLRGMVGAPLSRIFGSVLDSHETSLLDQAIAAYRSRFEPIGMFENAVYEGVPEALQEFQAAGHSLHVVTAKPTVAAARVLEHFGLAGYFVSVHGPELTDRECDKAALVRAALEVTGEAPDAAAMVGDRADDVRAARAHGACAIAALWGYGSRTELEAARPDLLAENVAELTAWVRRAGRIDSARGRETRRT